MNFKFFLSLIVATLVGAAATTQSLGQSVERPRGGAARQEGLVRVQTTIQLFVAGPTDDSEAADKHRERARRAVYEIAAKECDLMREVIAQECQLQSVNVNVNRQPNPQMQGYQVGGTMSYQITLK
jgi:hypothetical protein